MRVRDVRGRCVWAAICVAACGRSDPGRVTTEVPGPVSGSAVALARADAGVELAPADAPMDAPVAATPIVIPDELAKAPRWIFRDYATGRVAPTPGHPIQYTLQRHGERALLTIEHLAAHPTDADHLASPTAGPPLPRAQDAGTDAPGVRTQRLGTVATNGASSTITFDNDEPLACVTGRLRVAASNARRAGYQGKEPDCGYTGRWVPSTLRTVAVLRCNVREDPDGGRAEDYAFAPAPGIEYLYINDDCEMQGGGYRAIAQDGSVAPPRAK